jgi:hypothetical protein
MLSMESDVGSFRGLRPRGCSVKGAVIVELGFFMRSSDMSTAAVVRFDATIIATVVTLLSQLFFSH